MRVERDQPLAMVEHDRLAEEEVAAGVDGATRGGSDDPRACGRGDVEPRVRIARRSIDDAPRAEAAGASSARRSDEIERRRRGVGEGAQELREALALPLELLELRRRQVGALGRD